MSAGVLAFRTPAGPPTPAHAADPRYRVGARVSYGDMANPRRVFVIVGPAAKGWHRVVTEDGYGESQLHFRGLDSPGGWLAVDEPPVNPAALAYLVRAADASRERRVREQLAGNELRRRHVETGRAYLAARRPAWAKALIVAELHEDQSESMTDYFAHRTARVLVLAWSKHTRDLFPELRRAAAVAPETADLATAPADAEHREKWSMGGGYYLKADSRHANGWCVRKLPLSFSTAADEAVGADPKAYRVKAVRP